MQMPERDRRGRRTRVGLQVVVSCNVGPLTIRQNSQYVLGPGPYPQTPNMYFNGVYCSKYEKANLWLHV
ncbi:hypothetical protein H671_6g16896 [Cricetulus griseus]|nr:hypothetical protein H671_6g16896 [Cricetulus griseus]